MQNIMNDLFYLFWKQFIDKFYTFIFGLVTQSMYLCARNQKCIQINSRNLGT